MKRSAELEIFPNQLKKRFDEKKRVEFLISLCLLIRRGEKAYK